MEDQNKDGKSTSPLASSAAGSSGGMDSEMAEGLPGKASTTESVKESGARIASEAKQYAGDMASRAKDRGRNMFEQQKESAVGQVSSVAHAFRGTADQLQGEGQAQVARYIGLVADQLESFGGRLREKDLDTLIDDAQNLARRSPAAFFAGSVVTGFLLARFLKSSSERRRDQMAMSENEWASASGMEAERFSSMPGGRGTMGAGAAGTSSSAGIAPASAGTAPGAGSTPGTALGTAGVGTTPSSLSGSGTGGNSHGNR